MFSPGIGNPVLRRVGGVSGEVRREWCLQSPSFDITQLKWLMETRTVTMGPYFQPLKVDRKRELLWKFRCLDIVWILAITHRVPLLSGCLRRPLGRNNHWCSWPHVHTSHPLMMYMCTGVQKQSLVLLASCSHLTPANDVQMYRCTDTIIGAPGLMSHLRPANGAPHLHLHIARVFCSDCQRQQSYKLTIPT